MTSQRFSHGAVRSRIRRQLLSNPGRWRNYSGRFLALVVVVGSFAVLAAAVASQTLPKTFPFLIAYVVHDHFWLVLRGHLWTAQFPYSLIWALPLLAGFAVLVVEVLTPLGLRGLHRRILLALMRLGYDPLDPVSPTGAMIVRRWQDLTSPSDQAKGGFALRVAIEQRVATWNALREAHLAGRSLPDSDRRMLLAATRWCLRLDPASPRTVLATLEVIALSGPLASAELLPLVHKALPTVTAIDAQVSRIRNTLSILAGTTEAQGQGALALQRLSENGNADPVSLAADAIMLGALAGESGDSFARDWFALMARHRLGDAARPPPPQITEIAVAAMVLCDFAFWAYLAEAAVLTRERLKDPLLAHLALPATSAERFSSEGLL